MSRSSRSCLTFIIYASLSLPHLICCLSSQNAPAVVLVGWTITDLAITLSVILRQNKKNNRKERIKYLNVCCLDCCLHWLVTTALLFGKRISPSFTSLWPYLHLTCLQQHKNRTYHSSVIEHQQKPTAYIRTHTAGEKAFFSALYFILDCIGQLVVIQTPWYVLDWTTSTSATNWNWGQKHISSYRIPPAAPLFLSSFACSVL